jgi:hypothetical protein
MSKRTTKIDPDWFYDKSSNCPRRPPTEKLSLDNHLFWKTQILLALRCAWVMGLLDGSDHASPKTLKVEDEEKKKVMVSNQAYGIWLPRD